MTATSPNLGSLLQQRVQDCPDQLAYIFLSGKELRQSRLTYRELDSQARAIAGLLHGLKARGERALLLYPPGLEFIAAFFGCVYAGVIAVPAYPPRLNRNALRILSIARDSAATLAMTTGEVFSRLPAIAAHTPELAKLRWIATDNLDSQSAEIGQVFLPREEELAYLQYTSGSTADPRGVMITHANVLHNSGYLAKLLQHSGEDISLSWLPHFHDLGLVHGILQPLYSAFPGYLMAPISFLQRPLDWLKAISQFQVTHSDGPNFAYELCVNKIADADKRGLDLGSWKVALNGAEPVFQETIERFSAAFAAYGFKRTAFYPGYGLAEATLAVSAGKNGPELTSCSVVSSALEQNKVVITNELGLDHRILVGSGTFAPPMEVQVVDPEAGRKCAPDAIGEIWVAGPSVAPGYWNRADETAKVFKAKLEEHEERNFLRTGDLGFIHLGNIFVTGRLKELIIIRGRNHYPQDIERTAREGCPEISLGTSAAFSVSIGTEERVVLVQELQRHQKAGLQQVFRSIREAVAEEHEIQLLEIVLVKAGSIPRTSSGKIQRRLCRKEYLEGTLQAIGRWRAAPATDELEAQEDAAPVMDFDGIQIWLRSRISSRLGVDAGEIEFNRPLLHLGLDSLGAVELAHDVQNKLGIVWQPSTFLEDVTIADLAARAAQALEQPAPQGIHVPRASGAGEYPLSFGQQGLWFLHQLSPDSAAYNIVQAIRITSELDLSALRRSFQALVDRHGSLRTTFAVANGNPVQRLHHDIEVSFHSEDAQNWTDAQLDESLAVEAHRPFDLDHGPLFRVHVYRRSAREHVLLLVAHHIILDLWSLAQLMAELGVFYAAERSGAKADLPSPFSDYSQFVHWQKEMLAGDRGRQLWSYWSRQLAGELPVLELATDHARPAAQTFRGASCPFKLTAELTSGLKNLSQDCSATLYMTLLAAFQVLLHRYTGEDEILVGSPTAGRTHSEFASTVGYFVNPIVLRTAVSPGSSFDAFLRHRVRKTVLESLEHQDYPFSVLTERLQPVRDPRRSPIFQIMFAMQKAHLLHKEGLSLFALSESTAGTNLGGLEMRSIALEQRIAQFDLSLVMAEAPDGLWGIFEYNTDLFHAVTIRRMAAQFQRLLENVADDPGREISRLRLLTDAEATEMIHATQADSPGAPRGILTHQLFEQQAARTPDATAIIFEGQQLSYRELNRRANRLAHYLRHFGVQPGNLVAICLERSVEMITSLLAVLKAGAVYVPLDPEYPEERLDFLLHDSGAKVLITRERLLQSYRGSERRVLYLDAEEDAIALESPQNPDTHTDGHSLAYIIYTSGSTGAPKGALVSHDALSNHMQWLAAEFPLDENDRVLHKYSSSFDASLAEIFHPLITGAALVIARAGGQHDLRYLTDLMREHRVTEIDVVPTMLKALLEEEWISRCEGLRRIVSGGEALSAELKQRVYDRLGHIELVNMYGPTESAITATFHRCAPGQNEPRVAIGVPVSNTQVYLLDHHLQPVPVGPLGEIYIGGRGLAYGYFNQPALTAEKFVPDPLSRVSGARLYKTGDLGRYREGGILEYVGRADAQVKIRGFRIELGEIEAELKKHRSVRDVIALVKTRSGGGKYIAAYVQAAPGQTITSTQLRLWLQKTLPNHMMPAAIIIVDRLPHLPNGKADLRALPDPSHAIREEEVAPPRNHVEEALVRIWEQVLDRRNIGIHDNFFALGGDSILSIQAVARARQIGLELTPKQIFQFQTIADLAHNTGKNPARLELPETVEGPFPLAPIQRWFFEQDLNTANHYSQSLLLELNRPLDAALLAEAMHHVIVRHDALRLYFEHTARGWHQRTAGTEAAGILKYVPLMHLPHEEQLAQVDAISADIRASLNLREGPIIRAAYFDLGASNPHRLFLAAHHLAIDGVSWRILLHDLYQAYEQLKCGEKPALLHKPLSFQRWSELLQRHAQNEQVLRELAWWTAELSSPVNRLPLDHDGDNTAESSAILHVSLTPGETRRLLHKVPRAYRTEINHVLLTALAQTLIRWTNEPRVLIDLEGHGREEIIEGTDPSGTIGWFTTLYPVLLQVEPHSGPGERLKSVKEHLRHIPHKGIGFGLLCYLCDNPTISGLLASAPHAQVSFNYLGQLDQMSPAASPFRVLRIDGPMKTSFGRRSHVLEIDCYVKDDSLQVEWTYNELLHDQSTMQALATEFLEELRGLIQHCSSREKSECTPSDFPLVQISERQLKRIQEVHGPVADIYPLSPMQQGMLFHTLYEPHKGTYLTHLVCEFSGDLDREAFQAAWQHALDHHATLRSGFEWEIATEEPVQVVRQAAEPEWRFGDWGRVHSQAQSRLLDEYLREDRGRPMDLRRAPLMRFGLFATGGSKHLFIWSSHHLLMDGWSLPVVLKDVFANYEGLRRKQRIHPKPGPLYRDYIAWFKQQDLAMAEKFWQRWLQGFTVPSTLESLHRARAGASNSEAFCEYEVRLSEPETAELCGFARRHHLTLSTVTYGMWALLLSRITEKSDIVFGIVVSGRQAPLARTSEMVGVFINTLPLRAKIEPAALLRDWLQQLQEQQSEAAQFEHSPLSLVQSWSGVPRGIALFDNIVVFENYPVDSWNSISNDLRIVSMRSFERSNYPLTLWIMPGQQLCLKAGYDALLLDGAKVTALLDEYSALLAAVAAHPDRKISGVTGTGMTFPASQTNAPAVASPGAAVPQRATTSPDSMCLDSPDQETPLAGIGAAPVKQTQAAHSTRERDEQKL